MRFGRYGLLAVLVAAGGCQSQPFMSPPTFGVAHRGAVEGMIADPMAAQRNVEPVLGIDATSAHGIMENYHRNQQAEIQDERRRDREFLENR